MFMDWTILVTDSEMLLKNREYNWNGRRLLGLSDAFSEWLQYRSTCEDWLILAEKQETLDLAKRLKIPAVGLEQEGTVFLTGTPYILQGIGVESTAFLERVYRRYYGLPVRIIETERLWIREMKKSDTDFLFRLYQCKDVQREVDQAGLSREELGVFLEKYRQMRYPFYDYGMWIVEEKETGSLVGEAGIEEDTRLEEEAADGICLEAGYVISPKFRGKGYAVEALAGILAYVKEKKEIYLFKRVSCYIRPENLLSVRTAKRCGLQRQEGKRYGKQKEFEQYSLKLR